MKIHKDLTPERWFKFSLMEQLANVGSDVIRTILWKESDKGLSQQSFERVLELLDLTIADPKNRKQLKEMVRAREALVDHFVYNNEYNTTDQQWHDYFFEFNYAAALQRGR